MVLIVVISGSETVESVIPIEEFHEYVFPATPSTPMLSIVPEHTIKSVPALETGKGFTVTLKI